MRRLLFVLMLIVLTDVAHTQNVDNRGTTDYARRFVELGRAHAANPQDVEPMFNLALFYFDNMNPMRNLPLAMQYVKMAEERDVYMLENDKISELTKLGKKDINLMTIRQLKQAIRGAAENALQTDNNISLAEIDAYQEVFSTDANMMKQIRLTKLKTIYRQDLAAGTADSYYHFICTYPGTNEAEQMESHMSEKAAALFDNANDERDVDSIVERYKQSPSVGRYAERKKGRIAYAQAAQIGTMDAYADYLRRYPAGDDQLQARESIEQLQEAKYATLRTTRELANFAKTYPDNPLADDAMSEIRRRVMQERDVEAAELYLTQFEDDEKYNDILARYYSWHTEEGNSAPLRHFAKRFPDFFLQDVLESDIEAARNADRIDLTPDFLEMRYEDYGSYVRRLTGKRIAFVPLQRMIQRMVADKNWHAAAERISEFEFCFDNTTTDEYRELMSLLTAASKKKNRTGEFAQRYDILHPALNPMDGMIYFTRTDRYFPNKICCAKQEKGKWGVVADVKFSNADAAGLNFYGFFDDGKKMLLGNSNDIWIAERDGDGWRVSDIPPYPVNTDYMETDAFMLADGSGILLASDRPGGQNLQRSGDYFHGDTAAATDIYFIPYAHGVWGEAVNLGRAINTPYHEGSPIMSRNMLTLYFVTDSRGLGYNDIYVATRTSTDDWTHWSVAQNIGREANSGYNEMSVSFANGEKMLLIGSNAENGHYACFAIPTQHDTTRLSHTHVVYTGNTNGKLTRLRIVDVERQTIVSQESIIDSAQSIGLNVQSGRQYVALADAGNMFVAALPLTGKKKPTLQGYTYTQLVSMDKALPLPAVTFESKNDNLTYTARLQLEQLAQFAINHPTCRIEVIVCSDATNEEQAYRTTMQQGRAIKECLAANGLEHISVSAYGNALSKDDGMPTVSVRFREKRY